LRIQELGSEEGCYGAEDWYRNASLGVAESTLEKYPRSFIITIPRHPTWEVPSFVASIPRPSSSLSACHAHLITGYVLFSIARSRLITKVHDKRDHPPQILREHDRRRRPANQHIAEVQGRTRHTRARITRCNSCRRHARHDTTTTQSYMTNPSSPILHAGNIRLRHGSMSLTMQSISG
jgi:hypothetical protein